MIVIGGAGILAGILFVLALGWLRGDAPPLQTAAAAPAAAPAATKPTAPTIVESTPPPTWVGQRKATWARDGSKTIAFELQATRDVPAWMSRVRPVLVVQCVSRATHAFVVLGTSVKFEEDALHRTVQLQWDEGPITVQQWETSQSGQELFAPDGVAVVRQLATGNRLRFGFTPFNAQPVTAEFAVQGFDQLAGLVATTCGWRL
jgi:Type VI secretion system VasI, EvfG, VC_A0118